MGYTALYRKFRPLTFEEVVGQENITQTLKNQIIANRIGHAYLFNGGRGTGKTSSAKIFARAINCLDPKDGEPCNECEICKAILAGSLTDIVEMDAASNNSVEDIRSIREEVNFLPTKAKYRVYIIDEVHMLSTGAFNALLKTLEEPPEHVKFILATTEPQKIPATILSRCQRFDFKRIDTDSIVKKLKVVAKQSNIEITEQALKLIAILSEGAMRDALSLLERCTQDGETKIDEKKIKDLVGIPEITYIYQMVKGILETNVEEVIQTTKQVLKEGKDITQLIWEMISYVKDILLWKTTKTLEMYQKEELKQIENLANNISKEKLISLIYDLSELEKDVKTSTQKVILFEAGMIRLCYKKQKEEKQDIGNIEKRLSILEDKIANGVATLPRKEQKPKQKEQQKTKTVTQNITKIDGKVQDYWKDLVEELKNKGKIVIYTNLVNTVAKEINDMTIGIEFPNGITPFGKTVLEKPENMKEISNLVSLKVGKEMQIKLIDNKQQVQKELSPEANLENLANGFDIPIDIHE